MSSNGNGDPKITLRFTVLMWLLGVVLAGAMAFASVNIALARVEGDAKDMVLASVDRHELGAGHVSRDEVAELKSELRDIKRKLDQLSEDMAALKAIAGRKK